MNLPVLRLKPREERRIRSGHVWVFSNEVDVAHTPLTAFEPGQLATVTDATDHPLGTAYVNPAALICARLISRSPAQTLDTAWLVQRLKAALALRQVLFDTPYYRLVHGEGDGLPGLIVDRYGDTTVVQLNTAGMERAKDAVIEALHKVLAPTALVLRNDTSSRALEGLESYSEVIFGTPSEQLELIENGVHFSVPVLSGQKTGWFFDHRMNRARLQRYAPGKRVLDMFSYVGGWGIQAAVAGATGVTCVDSSGAALEQLAHNASRNGVTERVTSLKGDAFEVLKQLRAEQQHFDIVVLDPPAFIKRKKDAGEGIKAYQRLNQAAMQVLARDGLLISASCSYHLPREGLVELMLRASRHVDRTMTIIEHGHQGPDHPTHPAIPETDYIKTVFARVLPTV